MSVPKRLGGGCYSLKTPPSPNVGATVGRQRTLKPEVQSLCGPALPPYSGMNWLTDGIEIRGRKRRETIQVGWQRRMELSNRWSRTSWGLGLQVMLKSRDERIASVPLASESRDGVPASRCSPESTDTLLSRFTLPLSELKGGTPAWGFFRLELLGEIWLALAPWLPAPTPLEPRLQVGPWFTFWCWDWAPPFPVLP